MEQLRFSSKHRGCLKTKEQGVAAINVPLISAHGSIGKFSRGAIVVVTQLTIDDIDCNDLFNRKKRESESSPTGAKRKSIYIYALVIGLVLW